MKILIDNGHGGKDITNGKYSPLMKDMGIDDPTIIGGRFREGEFNRLVALNLVTRLVAAGYDAQLVTPEDEDISLGERVRRVNKWCDKLGANNVVLISVHADAAGHGNEWRAARGMTSRVCPHASKKSRWLGKVLWLESCKQGLKGNRWVPESGVIEQSLYILNNTRCPAVLTENCFYDNLSDVRILASPEGRELVVTAHYKALVKYCETYA